jgi:glutamate 5-kinase
VTHRGEPVAIGLSNFGSDALARIQGRHTSEIAGLLGAKDFDEVIHRDNLTLVDAASGR